MPLDFVSSFDSKMERWPTQKHYRKPEPEQIQTRRFRIIRKLRIDYIDAVGPGGARIPIIHPRPQRQLMLN